MKAFAWLLTSVFLGLCLPIPAMSEDAIPCTQCHEKSSPGLVVEWRRSSMARSGMQCTDCHGTSHTKAEDADKAVRPTIAACGRCHEKQAQRFALGKHGMAEKALAIPPMGKKVKSQAPIIFERACATCHNEICGGGGQCDACHSGHRFSAQEARKPEACLPCHMGNHPQYEAYSNSRHGALYRMRGLDAGAPTCSTCHLPQGDHMVKTSWGFFGVRGEEPDAERAANQTIVRGAVEMLGPILAPDSYRPDMGQWSELRENMLHVCAQCHTRSMAKKHLSAGDQVVAAANKIAAGMITGLQELRSLGECSENEYFWTIRDKMHAQRVSMFISAFHQYPEGVLLGFVHFQRETIDVNKRKQIFQSTKQKQ